MNCLFMQSPSKNISIYQHQGLCDVYIVVILLLLRFYFISDITAFFVVINFIASVLCCCWLGNKEG